MDAISASEEMSDEKMEKASLRWKKTETYFKNEAILNVNVQELCRVSSSTANYILAVLANESLQSAAKVGIGRMY